MHTEKISLHLTKAGIEEIWAPGTVPKINPDAAKQAVIAAAQAKIT